MHKVMHKKMVTKLNDRKMGFQIIFIAFLLLLCIAWLVLFLQSTCSIYIILK